VNGQRSIAFAKHQRLMDGAVFPALVVKTGSKRLKPRKVEVDSVGLTTRMQAAGVRTGMELGAPDHSIPALKQAFNTFRHVSLLFEAVIQREITNPHDLRSSLALSTPINMGLQMPQPCTYSQ
jgi:hypothetical protein